MAALKGEAREHKKRLRNRMLAGVFSSLFLSAVELIASSLLHVSRYCQSGDETSDLNLRIEPPIRRSPSPELLESDDEDEEAVPRTLRALPEHLPPLPPKHTYLRTPVSLPFAHRLILICACVLYISRSFPLPDKLDTNFDVWYCRYRHRRSKRYHPWRRNWKMQRWCKRVYVDCCWLQKSTLMRMTESYMEGW